MAPPHLRLLTAAGCSLCDEMREIVESAARLRRFTLEVSDITGQPELEAAWRTSIPVLIVEGRPAFKYRLTLARLLARIDRVPAEDTPQRGEGGAG